MNVRELIKTIEGNILILGNKKLKDRRLSSFDPELLMFAEDELIDNETIQAGGLAYYSVLLAKAKGYFIRKKGEYDVWWNDMYLKTSRALTEDSRYKPTAAIIESTLKQKYPKSYDIHMKEIREAERLVNLLEAWVNAWKQKSFSLNNVGTFKMRELGDRDQMRRTMKKTFEEK